LVLVVLHQVFRNKDLESFLGLLGKDGPGMLVDVKGVITLAEKKGKGIPGVLYWTL